MNILALQGSPRQHGNTATLLNAVLEPLSFRHKVHYFDVARLRLSPCHSCYRCQNEKSCIAHDDMDELYPKLADCDIVILASPIYFYGVTAQLKGVIDRCQYFWNNPPAVVSRRIGVLLLTAGAPDKDGQGVRITTEACRIFFRCLGAPLTHTLVATNTDRKPVSLQPNVLKAAATLGDLLATTDAESRLC